MITSAPDPGVEVDRPARAMEIRAMAPTDRALLERFHRGLSDDTTRLRYFAVHRSLTDAELERFTNVDHVDREAFVALVDDEIIGVGRFDRMGPGADAEVAFVVADAWQGRGVGTALLVRLEERAHAVGVERFVATTLPGNTRMLALLHEGHHPVRVSWDSGIARVVVELDAPERA